MMEDMHVIGGDSPLGEIFDHSVDNLGTTFQVITIAKVLG